MKLLKLTSIAFIMAIGALHASGNAVLCTSSSTGSCAGKGYCCYSGDSSSGDKYCKQLGCVRGGSGSCPNAANVKSCGTRVK